MVITVDAALDPAAYRGTIYGANLNELPWQALGACEALNIKLAGFGALVYDATGGFYPTV
jgi:hypothetical protein